MAVEETIKKKIRDLIERAQSLKGDNENRQVRSDGHLQECVGWMTAALNVIQIVVPNPDNAYRKRAEEIAGKRAGYSINRHVGEFSSLLNNLLCDIQRGLLTSIIADRARVETFDNFLDHAKQYLKEKHKNESGVIAGVVFEDSLRRVCRNNGIDDKDKKLDVLIDELAKKKIISQTKVKRAKVAAHVRAKATHAQWDEFDLKDVGVTIEFTEELITTQLDS